MSLEPTPVMEKEQCGPEPSGEHCSPGSKARVQRGTRFPRGREAEGQGPWLDV